MIITKLKINNLYSFNDVEIDFTYPKKNPKSNIESEYLEERPKFNFKRVCILMGTNASGKTSLGKVICGIENFIHKKTIVSYLSQGICDKDDVAKIEVEFITPSNYQIHRIFLEFEDSAFPLKDIVYQSLPLLKTDSNLSIRKKLDKHLEGVKIPRSCLISGEKELVQDKFNRFKEIDFLDMSWNFVFSENHSNDFKLARNSSISESLILKILQTFDSSIKDVKALFTEEKEGKRTRKKIEGYSVYFNNGNSIKVSDNGQVFSDTDKNRLSKGTYDVLSITDFIASIIDENKFGENLISSTHFLDEKLSSSHSELERSLLNLMIHKLPKRSQMFYTTHNYDILEMNLPTHSYLFMYKKYGETYVVQPENEFSKNDRSLLGYVKNNYFCTIPQTSLIDELVWE
ncbi:Predicted ATP-binding protein involved in virulence [Neisseria animaloris]|uniref:ATP-binding protein n=1 Tax=Neisseria animaloris TaxID=326522 RepID=UPI000A18BBD7|nr:ATP-binding protein [Neisseria animaloris]OSI06740.1 hypothetical protein BWD08_10715 [Neisseria animaloris]VEH86845.1 Predicted ATP-binding protein involved in virulence [Neisseria animaloris]